MIKQSKNRGYVLAGTLVLFTVFVTIVSVGLVGPATRRLATTRALIHSKTSYFVAEAGSEDAFYRLKNNLPVGFPYVLALGGGQATIDSDLVSFNEREIIAVGDVKEYIRKVAKNLFISDGFSFHFGVQAGLGGLLMENGSQVWGNVYSNGPIRGLGSQGNFIRGDAVSAGPDGSIEGINATGSIYSNQISNSKICGDAHYQTIDSPSFTYLHSPTSAICDTDITPGTAYPDSSDQPPVPFPISDELIASWQADAEAGGVIESPCPYTISSDAALGPVKINCDLIVTGNATRLTLNGNVWVSGDLLIEKRAAVMVNEDLGAKSAAIIADKQIERLTKGVITIQNNTSFWGSGDSSSYVILVSNNNAAENGSNAIAINVVNGAVGNLLVFAPHGEILVQNNVYLRETTAYRLHLINNTVVDYQVGLAQPLFVSGPGGTWKIRKWREI